MAQPKAKTTRKPQANANTQQYKFVAEPFQPREDYLLGLSRMRLYLLLSTSLMILSIYHGGLSTYIITSCALAMLWTMYGLHWLTQQNGG
jgi:hypothetical protein